MCERYFVQFPPQEPVTPELILAESLSLVLPKHVKLHQHAFFLPFESKDEESGGNNSKVKDQYDSTTTLRQNILYMIRKTRHFGLLVSQLTWVGLLNFAEKRRVLQHADDDLRLAALYIIILKKESSGLTQFINCLHMTGNHEIANVIEAKLEIIAIADNYGQCDNTGDCAICFETSLGNIHRHSVPAKKRKTSADSGFDDTDDDDDDDEQDLENSLAAAVSVKKYKCSIKPLDAVDVIAIINGKEDIRCKVELCKCGNYHQYPKWKEVNTFAGKEKTKMSSSYSESGLKKYFPRRNSTSSKQHQPKQGILSPVSSLPVEIGSDLSYGLMETLEFTQSRRSCSHLRLRFSNASELSEQSDSIEEETTEFRGRKSTSLKSKLPRFLRTLFD